MKITKPIASARASSIAQDRSAVRESTKTNPQDFPRTKTQSFDGLWNAGAFTRCVPLVSAEADAVLAIRPASLGLDELSNVIRKMHLLQHKLIGLSNKLSLPTERSEKLQVLGLLGALGKQQSAIFEKVVKDTDAMDPSHAVSAWVVHHNTLKAAGTTTRDQRMAYFADKAKKFVRAGGSMATIKPVSLEELQRFDSGTLVEWVVDEFDVARMANDETKPSPGHTLLSLGHDALSAGSMRVYKNDVGEIDQVLVGTFSGHFRANAQTLGHMVRHLVAAGVAPDKIVTHGGEAGSARALEVIQRTVGVSGADIQREQSRLNAVAARYNPYALRAEAKAGKKVAAASDNPPAILQALHKMRKISSEILSDGVLLESSGEASRLAEAIGTVLSMAENAGSPMAYRQGRELLRFVAGAGLQKDDGAKTVFYAMQDKWAVHSFGDGASALPADLLSAQPIDGRNVRIVATMNPRATEVQIREMLLAGMDVARFNPAHATIAELKEVIALVRKTAASLSRPISIQVDLPGPKIRLGEFTNPKNLEYNDIFLTAGDDIKIRNGGAKGTPTVLPLNLATLGDDVAVGDRFFMNDGLVELTATAVQTDDKGITTVDAKVIKGGKVWNKKGVNMPDSKLSLPTITDSDKLVLDALAKDIDILALSFVRSAECVIQGHEELAKRGMSIPILAKIERPEAVENLAAIGHLADGLMVARGDLGVEIGRENVPGVERRIHALGNRLGKPTMTATEVLFSMADGDGRASRADIEALYSAVADRGADAIMLGKETSFPEKPSIVVEEAAMTIRRAEDEMQDKLFAEFGD